MFLAQAAYRDRITTAVPSQRTVVNGRLYRPPKQVFLSLPMRYAHHGIVEFRPTEDRDVMWVVFPPPNAPPITRQYRVIKVNDSFQITIPSYWLKDRMLKAGQRVQLETDGTQLFVHLCR